MPAAPGRRSPAPVAARVCLAGTMAAALLLGMAAAAPAQPPEAPSAADPPPALEIEDSVEVVATTPLDGLGVDRDKVPVNVQRLADETLEGTGAWSLVENLQLLAPSVHVNEATTNPFQPDLQLRGFVASPLLGLPQGLAVYQNGVRLNEPFGDTVNWDLVPSQAIAGIDLLPGSNPLFGLNALGGAVALQTKTGETHPGHTGQLLTGSFGRHVVQGASGGQHRAWNWFVAGTAALDDGWRDASPSRVRQLFGDVGWRGRTTDAHLTLNVGHNRLVGNGAAPIQLLDEDRRAVFTYPDETRTRATLLTLRAQHRVSPRLLLETVLAYRRAGIDTFNGDDSNYDECDTDVVATFLCDDEGEGDLVRTPDGRLIPLGEGDELDGTNNTSATRTDGWSGALQATSVAPLAGRPNHLVAGVSLDGGLARYGADTELARLTDARGTIGTGLLDGAARVRLHTTVQHAGAYVADYFSITPRVTLTGAARFNHSRVVLRDRIGDDLNGRHRFISLNPSAGLTYQWPTGLTTYASLARSSRVPAPSELSCADPDDPCRLPNAFTADPPLDQVVATTWEGGVRGRQGGVRWNASLFRTRTRDDLMFISSGPLRNTGHFENVGRTLRHGLELAASGGSARLAWGTSYTLLRARFGAPLTLSSPRHPAAVDGEIAVAAGDRLPGVPQHHVKAHLTTQVRRLTAGLQFTRTSRHYLRGDESNDLPALDGASLLHLTASVVVNRRVRVIGRVANVLDARFATFGLLGEADEVLGGAYDDPRFLSPGAPRAISVGLAVAF